MQRISKETETKLIRSLEKVASLIQEGGTPSDAIIKVAQDGDLPIGHVQLMVQAYNNARFNQQRKSSSLVSEKAAHFTLADPSVIYETLYPSNVKEANIRSMRGTDISDEYARPPAAIEPDKFSMPHFTKVAEVISPKSTLPREPEYYVKKAHSLLKELDVEHSEKRRLMNAARDKVAAAFDDLIFYFKQTHHLPFSEVKEASIALYGNEVEPIFDHLSSEMPKVLKDRSGHYKVAVDRAQQPYSLVEQCLNKVNEYLSRFNDLGRFSKEAGAATIDVMNQFMPTPRQPLKGSLLQHKGTEKKAEFELGSLSSPLATMGSHLMGAALAQQVLSGLQPKEPEKLERGSLLKLMDPAHEQKLRGIRTQATFHDLMSNDEFLSGADPQHVAKLYNEISQVSPRAVDQPMLMRALLRRYVAQGQVDPHEVQQLAEIEGKLKAREEPIEPQPALPKELR